MNHSGWARVIALIFPYFIIVGLFHVAGAFVAGIPFGDKDFQETSLQQLIMTFFSFLGTLLLVWIFMKYMDKQNFMDVGLQIKNRKNDIIIGTILGLVIMGLAYVSLWAAEEIIYTKFNFDVLELIYTTLLFILVAILEEVLFRGYILKNLMLSFNKYIALIISSIVFAIAHGANPNISLFSLTGLFLAGIALGVSYIYTKNLWYPIAFHFSWNLFQSLFGFNVSGQDIYSIIEFTVPENNMMNGGQFGFEGSIFSLITELTLAALIIYYYQVKKRQTIRNENI
ncbi:CPBP family intramembrane glutamic endopeptidase [Maribacter dokdonensis]|uniref:CPBP family intramembrane glutamic endopeptidase n=1 Tax=Maribacter dokdonensis TaxID=320912 RepID=UPI002735D6D7|nr:type II CAAX endopeptidase family protein [Maribacter dokdonensis]MDP2527741.1 type II CAAX endopeptidase family protein [Maribacter dokdonensis]